MTQQHLTRSQRERIKQAQERRKAAFRSALPTPGQDSNLGQEQAGLVVTNYGTALIVEAADTTLFRCKTRRNLGNLVSGDSVIWQATGSGEGVVVAVEERRSLLTRLDYGGRPKPLAANLDQVAIVVAPYPELSELLIDRYLVAITLMQAIPLLVVNKADLLDNDAHTWVETRLSAYRRIGYPVLFTSNRLHHGLDSLAVHLKDRTSILVGQSGVGKSSLIKALLPDLEIHIRALSAASGQGTHATTATTLYHLPEGGALIDSPGVRNFAMGTVQPAELEQGFVEFAAHRGRCRFADCSHREEPGCALLAAVERGEIDPRRWASFQQIRDSMPVNGY